MKRCLFKLALFLLLGAIVNVAVAWGCVLRDFKLHDEGFLAIEDITRWWDAHVPENYQGTPVEASNYLAFGVSNSAILTQEPAKFVFRRRAGFPVRGLERSMWIDFTKKNPLRSKRHHLKVFKDRPPVPLRPIWPGFAINTIFYAVVVWLFWSSPFVARRMIRRNRGLCIKCGYDLRGTEHHVCPECGMNLNANERKTAIHERAVEHDA